MNSSGENDSLVGAHIRLGYAEQIREVIRGEIARGRWTNEMPSERHLSRELFVSRPTLRRALHALRSEGILEIQRGRPCRVVGGRRRPRNRDRAPTVMMLYHAQVQPEGTVLAALIFALQQKLHRVGYQLQLVDPAPPGTRSVERSLDRIDVKFRPSYYLLSTVPTAVQCWAARREVPSLVIGQRTPEVNLPALDVDQAATMRHAVDHLVRHGHRRIGLLNLPPFTIGAVTGTEAFLAACRGHASRGVTGTVQSCASRPAAVESVVRRFFEGESRPTAIVVGDLVLAIGLYTTLGSMGLRIPSQVSVVSTGYWPIMEFLRPRPTCYKFSWERLALRIVRILDGHLRFGKWPDTSWKLLPSLEEGGSVSSRARG